MQMRQSLFRREWELNMSISLNSDDLNNSASIASAINKSYYPNGEAVIVNTSRNQEGIYGDTLTSRTLTEVLSGDAFYQDPRYVNAALNKATNASLNSLITGGAQAAFYADAKAIAESDEESNAGSVPTVSGMAAFQQALGNTNILSTNLGGQAAANAFRAIENSVGANYVMAMGRSAAYAGTSSRGGNHASIDYISDSAAFTAGSRTVVIKDVTIGDEEFAWLQERIDVLSSVASDGMLQNAGDRGNVKNGFAFDIPNNLTGSVATRTYFPDLDHILSSVEDSIITLPVRTAHICPVLIEFLLYTQSENSSIRIAGGTGTWRANSPDNQGPNLSNGGKSLTDHAFGRAFDISIISSADGASSVNLGSEGSNVDKHRTALYMLLEMLDNMALQAPYLLPDLIVTSPDLETELGIVDGLEPENSPVKFRFKNLKYVNFYADGSHRSHIHISWSAARSGRYAGRGGLLSVPAFDLAVPATSSGGGFVPTITEENIPDSDIELFTRSFATGEDAGQLTVQQLFNLLRSTVMSPEAAAIFCAVAIRESGRLVRNFNPNTDSGDWSIGLFQINLLIGANGRHRFYLPSGNVTKYGWQLGYANYAAENITEDNFNDKARELYATYGSDKSRYYQYLDPLLWIPINQAYMVYTTASGGSLPSQNMTPSERLGYDPESGYVFFPWGDYSGGPTYGFISNVRFKDALDIYTSSGNLAASLRDWVLDMFNTSGAGSKSAQYAGYWVDGWVYRVDWSGGWTNPRFSKEDNINYTITVT